MAAAAPALPGGIVKGNRAAYRVVKPLAAGGMGYVYLGFDISSGLPVALKVPKPVPIAVKKARFEADLLELLDHRNIVRLIDKAAVNELPIVVEEFIDGTTLEYAIRRTGPLEVKKVMGITASILLALDYLHSLNIVHRDIKPKNVMVNNDVSPGSVKLIDLGTATYYNVSGLEEIVLSGGGYTAPEQYLYYALPQSDLWSVAAVTFYMLTGIHPQRVLGQNYYMRPVQPPDPAAYRSDLPETLRSFVIKGMSWHVLDRFLTAREALDYLDAGPVSVKRPIMEIMGVKIKLDTPIVVFGRKTAAPSRRGSTTVSARSEFLFTEEGNVKVEVSREGDITYVRVYDPYMWISLNHFELRYYKGRWCIRDLGSTNRTAVMTRERIVEIWRGRRVVSPCYWLSDRAIILVAYGSSLKNTPYMTVVVRNLGGTP